MKFYHRADLEMSRTTRELLAKAKRDPKRPDLTLELGDGRDWNVWKLPD